MARVETTINLDRTFTRRLDGFSRYCQAVADHAEQWAKDNKQWRDHTFDAWNGLFSFVIADENKVGFGVAHTEKYGVWLERDGNGRYAILKPAVEYYKNEFLNEARRWFGERN